MGYMIAFAIGCVSIASVIKHEMKEIRLSIDTLDRDVRKMNTCVSRLEGIVYERRTPYIVPIDET